MTFESAINSLTDGKAAKLTTWGGYVFRTDTTTGISAWAASTPYAVNDLVTYSGSTYVCGTAHTSGASFDESKWMQAPKYLITFRRRANSGSAPVDTPYTYTPTVVSGSVVYHIEPDDPSTEGDAMLKMDGTLLGAFHSNDWTVGTVDAFESARTGSSVW